MRGFVKAVDRQIMEVCLLSWLVCCCGFLAPAMAVGENSVADEIISLNVTNEPLGEVLEEISATTGYQFSIPADWEEFPITASIQDEPLHKALKIILRKLNNAVIYESEQKVKIKIYDESASSNNATGQAIFIGSSAETTPLVSPAQAATAPQPEVEMPEDDDPPNVEQSPDEDTEPVTDGNEAGDETGEAKEENEEQVPDSASGQQHDASDEDERQPDETESASQ